MDDHLPTRSPADPAETRHVVLRARIGLDHPPGLERAELEDRIAAAITEVIAELGGSLDVLQISLAARPDWNLFGPVNRVTVAPLWDPAQ